MRTPGLDALVTASRAANTPGQDARERNRRQLATRIAAGVGGTVLASASHEALATSTGGGAAAAGVSGSAGFTAGLAKWILVSVLIAAGAGVVLAVHSTRGRAQTAAAVASRPHAPVAAALPRAQAPETESPAELAPAEPPAPAVPATAGTGSSAAALNRAALDARAFDRELQLLRSARRALDAGSPNGALALLDRYAAEFPRGALRSECQAARILALCAAGKVAAADFARDQFLKQQPGSPLADRLRTSCGAGK